jgi:tetratricopeptide (TPR) repeat protein
MGKSGEWAGCVLALVLAAPAMAAVVTPTTATLPGASVDEDSSPDYKRGLEALHAGRLDEAEALAKRMLEVSPQSVAGRKLTGLVKARRGDLAAALADFDKALALDPQSIDARAERAVVEARLGQPDKAHADLEALRTRAASCGKTCPPELKAAVSRVEAAVAAARPPAAVAPETQRPAG